MTDPLEPDARAPGRGECAGCNGGTLAPFPIRNREPSGKPCRVGLTPSSPHQPPPAFWLLTT